MTKHQGIEPDYRRNHRPAAQVLQFDITTACCTLKVFTL